LVSHHDQPPDVRVAAEHALERGLEGGRLGGVALEYLVVDRQPVGRLHHAQHELAGDHALPGHAEAAHIAGLFAQAFSANGGQVIEDHREFVVDEQAQQVASTGDFRQFDTAKQFGAWLGLVPSQNSTGGKAGLGRITKRGDDFLRTLLIQGAKSAVMTAGKRSKRSDRISRWLLQLKERVGWQKAVVALANKNARILRAVLTRDGAFDPNHVPEAPAPYCPLSQPRAH
jgi:transposase